MDQDAPYSPQQMPPQPPSPTGDQPVAYDANGQPLYARPQPPMPTDPEDHAAQYYSKPTEIGSHITVAPHVVEGENYDPRIRAQYANEPMVVHATRNPDPEPFRISEETQKRSEESRKRYPHLSISDGEYVILDVSRHPIGMVMPLGAAAVVLIAFLVVMIVYPTDDEASGLPGFGLAIFIMVLVMALVLAGTFIAIWVYLQNRFFLTNESVIQEIQTSLFAKREQMVSLGSIEDASYRQTGILQTILNYGTLRLSTEGDETTYQFAYVADPRNQVSIVNNAIEAFKNGRPVDRHGVNHNGHDN